MVPDRDCVLLSSSDITEPTNLRTDNSICSDELAQKAIFCVIWGITKNKEVATSTQIMLDAVATATAKYSFCVIHWLG